MDDTPSFTADQVTKIYFDTKDAADAMSKRHAAEMEPLAKRLEVAKSWLLDYLNREGLENARTEHGLAYKSTIMSATVDPEGGWDALLKYIMERGIERVLDAIEKGAPEDQALGEFMAEPALGLLVRNVNKTVVKEMLEQNQEVPGVKIAHITQLNVRRS
jgi:hypothetical protein